MENNNLEIENVVGSDTKPKETETKVNGTETVTFTEEEVSKKIQSAEDKLRRKYSDEIKDLKKQIEELTPKTKSESELEIERRLAELEKSQAEVDAKKKFLDLQNSLKEKGIDERVANYLKDGVDVEEFTNTFNDILSSRAKSKGFMPKDHPSGDNITAEDFRKMPYDKRVELYEKNPTQYEKLSKMVR